MAEAIARVGIVDISNNWARKSRCIIVVVMATSCAAFAQHDHAGHAPAKALGEVQFETSCRPEAHKRFNQGMLYQHSFWYSAAKQAFEHALHADPACAIAYWGIAQSLLLNPFGPPPVKSLADGLAALEKGEGIAATEREKDFIRALKAFYAEHDKRDHRTRLQLYLKAMEEVAARYPQDDEAQIYYALALNVAASPSDKTYALPLKAAAILESIFKRRPQHPGVAHYLVHSYDYPADRREEGSKPQSAMPPSRDHRRTLCTCRPIFSPASGTGGNRSPQTWLRPRWRRKTRSRTISSTPWTISCTPICNSLKTSKARDVLEEMRKVTGVNAARHTGPFALAASAARHAVERADWKAAAGLRLSPSRFAHVDAITHFARALGAARSGAADAARSEIDQAPRVGREAEGRQGRVLGRAGRYPPTDCGGMGSLCGGQARRGFAGDACCR